MAVATEDKPCAAKPGQPSNQETVALAPPLSVTWSHNQCSAVLIRLVDGRPSEFLVGAPGEKYEWRPAAEVTAREPAKRPASANGVAATQR